MVVSLSNSKKQSGSYLTGETVGRTVLLNKIGFEFLIAISAFEALRMPVLIHSTLDFQSKGLLTTIAKLSNYLRVTRRAI